METSGVRFSAMLQIINQLNFKTMKAFIIINGKSVFFKKFETLKEAKTYTENYMDNSKEIIVREVEYPEIILYDLAQSMK